MKIRSLHKYFALFFLSGTIGIISCKKLVTIPAPVTEETTESVFAKNSSATSAMISVYSQMNDQRLAFFLPYLTGGLSGDELKNYSTTSDLVSFYTNSLNAQTASVTSDIWTPMYSDIYQANAVLEGVQGSNSITPAVAKQLMGEAKFVRAFCHYYLTNLFGDIPLITTTSYKITSVASRTSQAAVYQQIVADLTSAQSLLSQNFVDVSDTTTTTERVRPTSWAATALLAKVYLYTNDWVDAEKEASLVINNTTMFQLVTPLSKVFLKNSNEAIWQISPAPNFYYTQEGGGFVLTTAPTSAGFLGSSTLSSNLINAFEPNDQRFTNWVGTVGGFYFPYKLKASNSSTTTTEYSMILRLAEQYLIRAEARAQQNNLSGAQADLNIIRTRAGLPNTTATTQTSLLTAIQHERQIELFSEMGNRWLDLKITGTINAVMGGSTGVCASKGGTWNTNWQLYPIPQTERNADPNLTQNNGY